MEYMGDKVDYVLQEQRLGTGHAVQQARRYIDEGGYILILYGDTPLISTKTIKESIDYLIHEKLHAVVISADLEDPAGYGRIVRGGEGNFRKIVEHRDANEAERAIKEINSGMYVFSSAELAEALDLLKNDNDQGEYYLTDTLEIMLSKGYRVGVFKAADSDEVLGANDQEQLTQVAAILEKRIDP
jgi:bifunctional UDP-N-acetylglucosamine pyrophosphorylase/glucosamine-1-phosphate N-acetyltransferase